MTKHTDYIRQGSLFTMNGLPDPRLETDHKTDLSFTGILGQLKIDGMAGKAVRTIQTIWTNIFGNKEQFQRQ
jgi:hypothetical protein